MSLSSHSWMGRALVGSGAREQARGGLLSAAWTSWSRPAAMRAPGSQVSAAIFSKDLLCVTLLDRGVSAAHSARSGSRLGRKRRPAPRGRRELGAWGRESAPRPTGTGQRAVLLPAGTKRPAPAAPGPGEGGAGPATALGSPWAGAVASPPPQPRLALRRGRGDPAPQASALPAPGRGGADGRAGGGQLSRPRGH